MLVLVSFVQFFLDDYYSDLIHPVLIQILAASAFWEAAGMIFFNFDRVEKSIEEVFVSFVFGVFLQE